MRKIKSGNDEFVDLISLDNSCKACTVKAQPRFHSAIYLAGEYSRSLIDVEGIGRKT
jgi:hypothetical protein